MNGGMKMAKYAVLIIDDEEHILELMEYNLSTNGFKVFTATCIKEADEILKNEKIDLIFARYYATGFRWYECLKEIQARCPY